jgi:hypothetical protein
MGNTKFNATVTFDHEPTILIGGTASQNPLAEFCNARKSMSTVGARKRRNSLGSKRLHKHRDQGRQSDAAVEADRERSRAYQRYKRKVAQQTQQELANAKGQLAILRRQNDHLEALVGELEAHTEHGHVPDAMAADFSEENEFPKDAADPVDDSGAVGGWNADDVEMVIERLKKGSHKRFKGLFGLTSENKKPWQKWKQMKRHDSRVRLRRLALVRSGAHKSATCCEKQKEGGARKSVFGGQSTFI